MKNIDDFLLEPVPNERSVKPINILFVWMGFIMVVATMSFGGGLASQLSLNDLLWSVFIGNIFLASLSFVTGYIGSQSRLTFSTLASRVFTKQTWRIAILYIPLSLIGWYAIEAAIFGNLVADVFGLNDFLRRVIMSVSALLFSVTAYFGIRVMGKISYILVPLVFALSLLALSISLKDSSILTFGFGEKASLEAGTAIVMSTWIFSVLLVIPDLTRFIKNPFQAGAVAAAGVFIANSTALLLGAFAAALTQQSDPSLILTALGFAPLAILLSIAGIWSTNDNNMYSSALAVARTLSLPRRKVVLSLAAVGALIAFFNPATINIMFSFLIFMGASAPPLGGIVLGAYLFAKKLPEPEEFSLAPWVAWISASAICFQLEGIVVIPAGMFLGFTIWVMLRKLETAMRAR